MEPSENQPNTKAEKEAEAVEPDLPTEGTAAPEESDNPISLDKNELKQLAGEYPEAFREGALNLPQEVIDNQKQGMNLLEAYRLYDLKQTKQNYALLKARFDAEMSNKANEASSIGSVSGGRAYEKDFYSSQEWDNLPKKLKDKFIKNGKIFEFMKKWGRRS